MSEAAVKNSDTKGGVENLPAPRYQCSVGWEPEKGCHLKKRKSMSESEKDPKKPIKNQSRKKIKASTGAWWKSTVVTVDEPEPEVKENVTTEAPASDSGKADSPAQEKSPQPATAKKPAAPRKRRGRPASRKTKEDVAAGSEVESPTAEQSAPEPVAEQPAVAETAEGQSAPGEQAAEVKPKRARQPRGRRGGRKKTAGQKSSEAVSEQPETALEENKEGAQELRVDQKQPRKQSKPAPEKKKRKKRKLLRARSLLSNC